jgi:hypothetical protein
LQVQINFDTIINRQHAPSARWQRRRVVHVRRCRARSPPIFRASATASGRASQCGYSSSVALTGGLWASRHDGAGSLFPFSSSPPLLLSPFFYFMNNGSTAPGWASWRWQQRVLSAEAMARYSSLPLLLPILLPFSDDRRMDWYWGISPCGGGSERVRGEADEWGLYTRAARVQGWTMASGRSSQVVWRASRCASTVGAAMGAGASSPCPPPGPPATSRGKKQMKGKSGERNRLNGGAHLAVTAAVW